MSDSTVRNPTALQDNIARLEIELEGLRNQLQSLSTDHKASSGEFPPATCNQQPDHEPDDEPEDAASSALALSTSSLHSLLVLTDSALPLGSFAFSSGLESLLMHRPKQPKQTTLRHFLLHSLASVARLAVPYLLKAHQDPSTLLDIDNDLDASTPCTVARRASVAQGRALLTTWERALRAYARPSEAFEALTKFSKELKLSSDVTFEVCAHLAPVFGAVAAALQLEAYLTVYTFLLNHVKAVLSAAIRAGVLGPFQAQAVLSSGWLKSELDGHAEAAKILTIEEAGQVWVPGDIWVGRHELLYSRIFNS